MSDSLPVDERWTVEPVGVTIREGRLHCVWCDGRIDPMERQSLMAVVRNATASDGALPDAADEADAPDLRTTDAGTRMRMTCAECGTDNVLLFRARTN
jgi:hypothetical protein